MKSSTVKIHDIATKQDGSLVMLFPDGTWSTFDTSSVESNSAQEQVVGDSFRGTQWGMSKAQIKGIEKFENTVDDPNSLSFRGTIGNSSVVIHYFFVDDLLVKAYCSILDEHSTNNLYLHDYESWNKLLIKKYGQAEDNHIWSDETFKDDPEDWGLAVSSGALKIVTNWETAETEIVHLLSGDNYEVLHMIAYNSVKFKNLDEADNEILTLDEI